MIFVTLGTQDKSFERLLNAVEEAAKKGFIKEKIIVQAGHTSYESELMEIFDYVDSETFEKMIKSCDLLITHGGVGSILAGVMNKKKVIAAARLSKFAEHTNDHQLQIINEFVDSGYILELKDFKQLDKVITKSKRFKPKPLQTGTNQMIKLLEDYIDKL